MTELPSDPVEPSPDRALTIEQHAADDGTVQLRLRGELDAYTAPDLEQALVTPLESGAAVEIDLTEVTFVDSSGLAALLDGRTRLNAAEGSLRVTATSLAVDRLFTMTGVSHHLMGPAE